MKQAKAIAYFRQLCCLGLSVEVVMPEILKTIQTVIPSGSNIYVKIDDPICPVYFILESGLPLVIDINEIFSVTISFFSNESGKRFVNWLLAHTTLTEATVINKHFYRTDLYNLIYRPYSQHHPLSSLVRVNGKPAGIMNLFRPHQQKPFNNKEQVLMMQLLPYVSHALQSPPPPPIITIFNIVNTAIQD